MKRIDSIRLLLMDQILSALIHVSKEIDRVEKLCKIDVTNNANDSYILHRKEIDIDSYILHKKEYDLLSKEIALLEELDAFYCEHYPSL